MTWRQFMSIMVMDSSLLRPIPGIAGPRPTPGLHGAASPTRGTVDSAAASSLVPVGAVNPSAADLATDLRGTADEGVGRHWWRQLTPADYTAHKLPNPVSGAAAVSDRPAGW